MNGSYEILADLDFTGKAWPKAFSAGNYTGTILGGGHKLSGISVQQAFITDTYCGVFATITENAHIENVNFENVTFNLRAGSRKGGAAFGLLAGSIASGATFENVTVSGTFAVYPEVKWDNENCTYGLVVGAGEVPENISANVTLEKCDDGSIVNNLTVTLDQATGEITITKEDA